nr:LOW QUALITY PROTEIN: very-long-chain enoyl-CoA reductase-like [Saimiri boliviensis boliviensis]
MCLATARRGWGLPRTRGEAGAPLRKMQGIPSGCVINAQWKPERAQGESKDSRTASLPALTDRRGWQAVLPLLLVVTVFLTEYSGPLFVYLLFYFRVPFICGHKYDFTSSRHTVVHLACICHSFHYVKRLLETLFVHRFSHGTMSLHNIFKNCICYWGFAAWMAYYINHPLYTPPTYGTQQVKLALAIFVICQLSNFSIHVALRDLRPAGSKTRKIPYPTKNPFTWLFLLVSCPNYTYEVGSWIGFAIMTQCLPVALFSLVGFTQMTIWAKGKHRSYLKEFRDYPPLRMPIIPFLLGVLTPAWAQPPSRGHPRVGAGLTALQHLE